jgi:hypothetical protein
VAVDGTRLADAETVARTTAFSRRPALIRDYVAACRQAEDEVSAAREALRQAELRHARDRQESAKAEAAAKTRSLENLRSVLRPRNWLGGGDR